MKKIEALVKPFKIEGLKTALTKAKIDLIQVYKSQVIGGTKRQELIRGTEFEVDTYPMALIIMVVANNQVDSIIKIIKQYCSTGNSDDGHIIVTSIEALEHIHSQEKEG